MKKKYFVALLVVIVITLVTAITLGQQKRSTKNQPISYADPTNWDEWLLPTEQQEA